MDTVGFRCSVAALLGAVAGFVGALVIVWQAAILVGWDAAAICCLPWTWKTIGGLDAAGTKRHANVEDASQRIAEAIILVAGVALLAAGGGSGQGRAVSAARRPISSPSALSASSCRGRPSTRYSRCDTPGRIIRIRKAELISTRRTLLPTSTLLTWRLRSE